jgi:hypothetical protein
MNCWIKGNGPIGVPMQMNPSVTSGSSAKIRLFLWTSLIHVLGFTMVPACNKLRLDLERLISTPTQVMRMAC